MAQGTPLALVLALALALDQGAPSGVGSVARLQAVDLTQVALLHMVAAALLRVVLGRHRAAVHPARMQAHACMGHGA